VSYLQYLQCAPRLRSGRLKIVLRRGLLSGHPEMPDFVFPQQDVGAILRYLRSIQER
jgi:hypothetical protein